MARWRNLPFEIKSIILTLHFMDAIETIQDNCQFGTCRKHESDKIVEPVNMILAAPELLGEFKRLTFAILNVCSAFKKLCSEPSSDLSLSHLSHVGKTKLVSSVPRKFGVVLTGYGEYVVGDLSRAQYWTYVLTQYKRAENIIRWLGIVQAKLRKLLDGYLSAISKSGPKDAYRLSSNDALKKVKRGLQRLIPKRNV